MPALGVVDDAVAHLEGEIEPFSVLFEHVHHAQRLFAVAESRGIEGGEHAFADVPEGRMPQIVPQRDRLGEILVERKTACKRTGDLRDVERVRKARHVVIAVGREKDLRLIFQPQERLGIDDAVAVALEVGSHGAGGFLPQPPLALVRLCGILREKRAFFFVGLFLHHTLFRKKSENSLFFGKIFKNFHIRAKTRRPRPRSAP